MMLTLLLSLHLPEEPLEVISPHPSVFTLLLPLKKDGFLPLLILMSSTSPVQSSNNPTVDNWEFLSVNVATMLIPATPLSLLSMEF